MHLLTMLISAYFFFFDKKLLQNHRESKEIFVTLVYDMYREVGRTIYNCTTMTIVVVDGCWVQPETLFIFAILSLFHTCMKISVSRILATTSSRTRFSLRFSPSGYAGQIVIQLSKAHLQPQVQFIYYIKKIIIVFENFNFMFLNFLNTINQCSLMKTTG